MDREFIKQYLFERLPLDIQFDRDLFNEAFDKIPDDKLEQKIVDNEHEIDSDNLFGKIEDVIAFLQKAKSEGYIEVCEGWLGREDNYFFLTKKGKEENKAYCNRLWSMVRSNADKIKMQRAKTRNDEIARLEAEIARLKSKL